MTEAHSALGAGQTCYDLDWTGAERSFKRAIELNPGSPWARTWYGDLLAYPGRSDEAIDAARRAMVIEPLSPIIRWNVIQNLGLGGQLDESEREARTAMELFPDAFQHTSSA